ncbi:hypothetical protein B0H10DRAFT_1959863 [Mycena sp. CBHHK59/15]|nr:hypothetical protein B0H10DRAFT_1959863 [Mycena sp. CBHHK59/15]
MAPRTRRTAEPDPTPPAPAGFAPDLTPPNPVAPSHAARGSQHNTVTAQGEPAPPARASGSSEQARGFAPLTYQPGIRSAASQNPQPAPHTPTRPTNALAQQTPPQTRLFLEPYNIPHNLQITAQEMISAKHAK